MYVFATSNITEAQCVQWQHFKEPVFEADSRPASEIKRRCNETRQHQSASQDCERPAWRFSCGALPSALSGTCSHAPALL